MKWIFDLSGNRKKDFFTEVSGNMPHFNVVSGAFKNLQGLVQSLGLLIQSTPSIWRLATAALLLQSVRASQCQQLSGDYSTIYMNSTQDDGLLAIQYSESSYVLPALDNVCNFTLSDQKLVTYPELECMCGIKPWPSTQVSYKVILKGQNISVDALNCIKEILEKNCYKSTTKDSNDLLITMGILFAASFLIPGFGALCQYALIYCVRLYGEMQREREWEQMSCKRVLKLPGIGAKLGNESGTIYLREEKSGIREGWDLHLISEFDIERCEEIKGNTVILTNRNTAYFIVDNRIVMEDDKPKAVKGINRQEITPSRSTKPIKYISSEQKKDKIIFESTLKGGQHTIMMAYWPANNVYAPREISAVKKGKILGFLNGSNEITSSSESFSAVASLCGYTPLKRKRKKYSYEELKNVRPPGRPFTYFNGGSLAVWLIGGLSAYGTGAIKGSQINDFFELFGISAEFLQHPAFLLLVLPVIPALNVWFLHSNENQKALADITGYEFHGVSEHIDLKSIQPKPGQLYIKKSLSLPNPNQDHGESRNVLSYVTLFPDGETLTEVIDINEQQLRKIIPEIVIDAEFHIDELRPYFPRILSITNAYGHTRFDHPANRIRQIKQLCRGAYLQFRKEPISTLLITLAAVTEGMMVTSSVLKLLGNNKKLIGFAASFGILDAIQFILLDGKSLSERLNQNFFYTSPKYESYLNKLNYFKSLCVKSCVHFIPAVGALVYIALAFIETRELIEHMVVSDNEDYKEDIGSIFGLPLALIYGGIQYSLYGYRTQQAIADLIRKGCGDWCGDWCGKSPRDHSSIEHKIQAPQRFRHLKKGSAIVASFVEAITVFSASASFYKVWNGEFPRDVSLAIIAFLSGSVGFAQNYWVEGYELMGIHPEEDHPTESEESAQPFKRGGEIYPLLPEFLGGMLRLSTFTFLRTLIQRTLIPDTVSADEVTYAVTLSSYLCSSTASLATWGIGELILFRALKFHAELHTLSSDEKQTEHGQLTVHRGRQRSETDVSISDTDRKEMSLSELNKYETRKYMQAEAKHQFRYSKGRLMLQGMTQFITPILIATVLEKSLKRLFTSHSHLDAEESLNNSQTLASLSTGLIVMMLGYLVDYMYGYKDRKLLSQLKELDREEALLYGNHNPLDMSDEKKLDNKLITSMTELDREDTILYSAYNFPDMDNGKKSDNKLTPKAKKQDMAQGLEGYDLDTFFKLIYQLDSKQEKTLSGQTVKIIGVLKFSDDVIFTESKSREMKYEQKIEATVKHEYKLELYGKDGVKSYKESVMRNQLKDELKKLNNNCSLLLPYYYSVDTNGESLFSPEEYGFIHFSKQQEEIRGICYNPSNNRVVNLYLKNYFEKIISKPVVKCLSLRTATPMNPINSGPWVIMQIQAILNREIDLIASPHKLAPETNLSGVRLSQFSFLSQLPTVRNLSSTSMEMKIRVN